MKVGVILYVNRSGSTLFSRMLGEGAENVFVFPELGFPLRLLMERAAGRRVAGAALAALVLADPRRGAIGLADAALAAIGVRHSSDDLEALLRDIAAAALGRDPAAIVIKLESLAYVADAIVAAFADVQFFHVVRDPRAVASSMMLTPVPEKPGFDMARGSVVYAARHWRDYLGRVRRLAEARTVTEIRYEALRGADDVVGRAAAMLGVARRSTAAPAGATYRIASIDDPLHPRVHEPFDRERLEGWRHQLSPRSIRTIEAICWDEMIAAGYTPVFRRAPRFGAAMLAARLAHGRAMTRHVVRTAAIYARRPGGLADLRRRVALAVRARKG